jgi:putative flavoprotein involved in K+ transport
VPRVQDMDAFGGRVMHSSTFKNPHGFEGKRIIVVGAGNSAIQIAAELAEVAHVTLASREPLRLQPQRILGRDVHFWLRVTGVDYILPPPSRRFSPPLDSSPMFSAFTKTGVRWADGREQTADVVLFATGFVQQPAFLASLQPIQQRAGIAQNVPGLYFVGLPYQRNFASATLRGAGPDAAHIIKHLVKQLSRELVRGARSAAHNLAAQ